jgi:hypothetical protein
MSGKSKLAAAFLVAGGLVILSALIPAQRSRVPVEAMGVAPS